MASSCAVCGFRKQASIHLGRINPGWHAFQDARRPGMRAVSEGMQAYRDSQTHTDVMAAAESATCEMEFGSPVPCFGKLTPHHTLPKGRAGGQRKSEADAPLVTVCAGHNTWLTETVVGMRWGVSHSFERDGVRHPFLLSRKGEA